MRELINQYGDERLKSNADGLMNNLDAFRPEHSLEQLEDQEIWDDFEAAGVNSKAEIREAYSGNFYFGCEADDPATMWAFNPKMGARLRPVFSSDFTHFDVPDFAAVLPEAYEMVEEGMLNDQDFKEFTFTNAVKLHGGMNANFFKGTRIERQTSEILGG